MWIRPYIGDVSTFIQRKFEENRGILGVEIDRRSGRKIGQNGGGFCVFTDVFLTVLEIYLNVDTFSKCGYDPLSVYRRCIRIYSIQFQRDLMNFRSKNRPMKTANLFSSKSAILTFLEMVIV